MTSTLPPSLASAGQALRSTQAPRTPLQAASEDFEALFLQQLLKEMRKAGDVLSEGSPLRSRQLDTLRDLHDEALARHLAGSGQAGIAELLVSQLGGDPPDPARRPAAPLERLPAPVARPVHPVPRRTLGEWLGGAADLVAGVAAPLSPLVRGAVAFRSLVSSVVRHESAGDARAVSAKGALGLMQLMPGTARDMAQALGLPFDLQRLLDDPDYNLRLGSAYLEQLLERYDQQPALALAAYNAGPGRVDEWLSSVGDPRRGELSVEAWVDAIPYAETRAYTRGILRDLNRASPPVAPSPSRGGLPSQSGAFAPSIRPRHEENDA
ncbi:hypothetical protein A7D27_18775 [Pseudomonas sp. 1D4]|uniref:lytic transglycosylase domain-containing protein n=1 Tax=Pseudomonas sp. 1D4 TaxID=1843691 RepID=UPI00084ABB6E|nr:transglycosylase SLT domain-containing protein [Pseudomonas sp. 1D4]OEC39389.1 hypothetical protein A7D27_18775 [Pseudomonas sp. 1D4]